MSTGAPILAPDDHALAPTAVLPDGTRSIWPGGLLGSVMRPCPEHARECRCVARREDGGGLVFWCEDGAHHFSVR